MPYTHGTFKGPTSKFLTEGKTYRIDRSHGVPFVVDDMDMPLFIEHMVADFKFCDAPDAIKTAEDLQKLIDETFDAAKAANDAYCKTVDEIMTGFKQRFADSTVADPIKNALIAMFGQRLEMLALDSLRRK